MKKFVLHLCRIVGFALELLFKASKRRQTTESDEGCHIVNSDRPRKSEQKEGDMHD